MTAAIALLLALAGGVATSTTFVRNAIDKNSKLPSWVWNAVPVAIGLGYCLGWQIEVVSAFAVHIPALKDRAMSFDGPAGQALSGLLAGLLAGPAHSIYEVLSGTAKTKIAQAQLHQQAVDASAPPTVIPTDLPGSP